MQNYRGPRGKCSALVAGYLDLPNTLDAGMVREGGYERLLRRVEDSVSVDKWQDTVEYRTNLDNEWIC